MVHKNRLAWRYTAFHNTDRLPNSIVSGTARLILKSRGHMHSYPMIGYKCTNKVNIGN